MKKASTSGSTLYKQGKAVIRTRRHCQHLVLAARGQTKEVFQDLLMMWSHNVFCTSLPPAAHAFSSKGRCLCRTSASVDSSAPPTMPRFPKREHTKEKAKLTPTEQAVYHRARYPTIRICCPRSSRPSSLRLFFGSWGRKESLGMLRNFLATIAGRCDAVSCFFGRRWWRRCPWSSFQSSSLLAAMANNTRGDAGDSLANAYSLVEAGPQLELALGFHEPWPSQLAGISYEGNI